MGRAWRIEYEGGLYHVLSRGNERNDSKYMPNKIQKEIPQQRLLGRSLDPVKALEKAAGILNCDLDVIRHSRRIPKSLKG